MEKLLGQIEFGNLRGHYLFEIKTVSDFILDLVFDYRENILHVHDGVVERQTETQSRIGLAVVLERSCLELLLFGLGQTLDLVVVNLLLDVDEKLLLLLYVVLLKVFGDLLHLRDRVTFRGQQQALLLLSRLLGEVGCRVAELVREDVRLGVVALPVELLIDLEAAESHVEPELWVLL
jgi:hypothetical protein